jgi:hypothetical protein
MKHNPTNLIAHHLTTHITYVADIVVPSNAKWYTGKWYIARSPEISTWKSNKSGTWTRDNSTKSPVSWCTAYVLTQKSEMSKYETWLWIMRYSFLFHPPLFINFNIMSHFGVLWRKLPYSKLLHTVRQNIMCKEHIIKPLIINMITPWHSLHQIPQERT